MGRTPRRLVVLILFWLLADAQEDCATLKSQDTYQACGPVDSVLGPSAPTCFVTNYTSSSTSTLPQYCRLPYEIRVGLTISLTGPLAHVDNPNSTTLRILDLLASASSQISIAEEEVQLSNGQRILSVESCLRFCVMDDGSSEQNMVDLYRSFVGANQSEPNVDLLLGPGTFQFRKAAAQVADEYQVPMLLWSLPDELANVGTAEQTPLELFLEGGARSSNSASVDFGRYFQASTAHNCANNFSVPSGYYLRRGAEFLTCDGYCDEQRDLEFCCRPDGGLVVSGQWTPSDAVVSTDWQDGCLRGESNGSVPVSISLTLSLGRSCLPVSILSISDEFRQPDFIVQGHRIPAELAQADVLPDGAIVTYNQNYLSASSWSICIRQNCTAMTCPATYRQREGENYCMGQFCSADSEEDVAACCEKQADVRSDVLFKTEWTSVFDLLPRVEVWAQDVLHQLQVQIPADPVAAEDADLGNRLVCVAESLDSSGFYGELCISYMHYAMNTLKWQTGPYPFTVRVTEVGRTLSQIFLNQPRPTVVLICGSLNFYASSFFFMKMNQIVFRSVISWTPWDKDLLDAVGTGGSSLKYRYLEPVPWPSTTEMIRTGTANTEMFTVLGSLQEDYQAVSNKDLARYGNFPAPLLFLMSAWQVFDALALGFVAFRLQSFDQEPFGRNTKLRLLRGRRKPEQRGLEFKTFLSPKLSFDWGGERLNVKRDDLSTQQFVADGVSTPIAGASPATTWQAAMARYTYGVVRPADQLQRILSLDTSAVLVYPCPKGCVELGSVCEPCAPGYFRAADGNACQRCPVGNYQDQWAGSQCFECPEGATCAANATDAPVANYGWFLETNTALPANFALFNSASACSILPGGGLHTFPTWDLRGWDATKNVPSWNLHRCKPAEICLGGNICAEGHEGVHCASCKAGYSRYLRFTQVCEVCPDLLQQLAICAGVVALQLFMAAWMSRSTLSSAEESSCLQAPLALTLLQSLQIYSLLLRTVNKSFNLSWATMIPVADILMTPFLLPLMSCLQTAETVEGVQLHVLWIFLSAGFGYLLVGLRFLVRIRHRNVVNDFLRHVLALNVVTLPYCIYWAVHYTSFCSVDDIVLSGPAACLRASGPSYALVAFICMARILELYAVWSSRYDLNRIQVRRRFGLLFTALQPRYYLWFAMEGTALFALAGAIPVLDTVSGIILILANQVFMRVLYAISTPFWTVNRQALRKTKQRVSTCVIFAAAVCALGSVFEEWLEAILQAANVGMAILDASYTRNQLQQHQLLEGMVDLALFSSEIYVVAMCVWKIFYNKFAFTWAVEEQTGSPMRPGYRKFIHMLRLLFGLRSISVSIDGATLQMDTKRASKKQRDDLLVSMRMALLWRLSEDAPFRFTDVRQILMAATNGILRVHRSAWQKHFINIEANVVSGHGDPIKGYSHAFFDVVGALPGADHNELFRRHADAHTEQKIFPEEINAAVQDMCVTGSRRVLKPRRLKPPSLVKTLQMSSKIVRLPMHGMFPFRHAPAVVEEDEEEEPEMQNENARPRQVLRRPDRKRDSQKIAARIKWKEAKDRLELGEPFLHRRLQLSKAMRASEMLERDSVILAADAESSTTGQQLNALQAKIAVVQSLQSTLFDTYDQPNPPASALATFEQLIPREVRRLHRMRSDGSGEDLMSPVSTKFSRQEEVEDHCTAVLGGAVLHHVELTGSWHTAPVLNPNEQPREEAPRRSSQTSRRSSESSGEVADSFEKADKVIKLAHIPERPPKMRLPRWKPQGGIGRSTAQLHRTVQQAGVASP